MVERQINIDDNSSHDQLPSDQFNIHFCFIKVSGNLLHKRVHDIPDIEHIDSFRVKKKACCDTSDHL